MLELKDVKKIYHTKEKVDVIALDNINLSFPNNGLIFILGPSGSGKTTLLNLLGGIDQSTEGKILYDGKNLLELSMEDYRRNIVSFVFQEFNLIPNLNVYDNISLVTSKNEKNEKDKLVEDILLRLGLDGYQKRRIQELSGGQKQRIAIGRALAKGCKILLCDEPTGNLDSKSSKEIFEILKNISKEKLVIVNSHNEELAQEYSDRIISIRDGKIENDIKKNEIEKIKEDYIENNNISFSSKLRYALSSLFSCKLKTIISTILIILSLLSVCLMIVFLTYNAERVNALSSKNDSIEYLVKNTGADLQPNNLNFSTLNDVNSIIDEDKYIDGYNIQKTNFYIVNDKNKHIIDSLNYYFKDELETNSCYVTDFYINFTLNTNDKYKINNYSSFNDLKNTDVYYNDVFQYKIAGVIKTDYLSFYDITGNKNEKIIDKYSEIRDYQGDFNKKTYCEYNVIYGNMETFESISSGINYFYYNNYDSNITVKTDYILKKLTSINISYINEVYNFNFFMNDGYYGSLSKEDEYYKKIVLDKNDVVITPALYDFIFDTKIEWENLNFLYQNGIYEGKPYTNALSHLGETVSFTIEKNGKKTVFSNVTIVGVNNELLEGDSYRIYSIDNRKISNYFLSNCTMKIVDWKNINNKNYVLKELRKIDILLAGGKFTAAYDLEYSYKMMSYFFIALGIMTVFISIISIINLVINRINDNKKEIGILYASGCNKTDIEEMYLIPIAIITFSSLLFSAILVAISCEVLNHVIAHKGIEYISPLFLNIESILALLFSAILMIFFGHIPLKRYLKKKPIDIIR